MPNVELHIQGNAVVMWWTGTDVTQVASEAVQLLQMEVPLVVRAKEMFASSNSRRGVFAEVHWAADHEEIAKTSPAELDGWEGRVREIIQRMRPDPFGRET